LAHCVPSNYFSGHDDSNFKKIKMKTIREKVGKWITQMMEKIFNLELPNPPTIIDPTTPWPRTSFASPSYAVEPMQDLECDGLDATELQALIDAHSTESVKEPVVKDWNEQAWDLLNDYIFLEGEDHEFLAEEFVAFAKELMKPPTDARSWGTPIRRAAKAGIIVKVGYRPAHTSNRSPKCLWRVV
jgi:hypothetical protein